jgi:CRP-like cAMP-binding protein
VADASLTSDTIPAIAILIMILRTDKLGPSSTIIPANHVLASLPPEELKALSPHLERVEIPSRTTIYEVGGTVKDCYFVTSGLISCVMVMENGDGVEVGLIGHEGFVGLPALINIVHSSILVNVQVPGEALRIDAIVLHELLDKLPSLQRLLSRYAYLQALQSQQIAGCNRLHEVEERLARWLLMTQDRVQMDVLPLTHDLLSMMLGARRASVTVAAGILQRAGLIEYRRGKIVILDRKRLEEAACECDGVIRKQLNAYLATGMSIRPEA